jgi:hypothetical protein
MRSVAFLSPLLDNLFYMRHVFEMQPVKHHLEGQNYFLYSPLCLYSFEQQQQED